MKVESNVEFWQVKDAIINAMDRMEMEEEEVVEFVRDIVTFLSEDSMKSLLLYIQEECYED